MNEHEEKLLMPKEDMEFHVELAIEMANDILKLVITKISELDNPKINYFLLEEMILSYTIAFSNYTLFKTVNQKSWDDYKTKTLYSISLAFEHIEQEKINKNINELKSYEKTH